MSDLVAAFLRARARYGEDGPLCPACGRPLPLPLPHCTCTHLELSHELNAKGVRTACFHIGGPRGIRCPCKRFTLPTV